MSRTHPCPVCGEVVPVSDALDNGCPECGAERWQLHNAAHRAREEREAALIPDAETGRAD